MSILLSLKHSIPACDLKCVNGGLDSEHCKCICYKDFTGKICNGECLECMLVTFVYVNTFLSV